MNKSQKLISLSESKVSNALKDLKRLGFKLEEDNGNGFTSYSHKDLDKHYQLAMNDEASTFHTSPIMIRSDKGRSDGDFGVSDSVSTVKEALGILKNFVKGSLLSYIS